MAWYLNLNIIAILPQSKSQGEKHFFQFLSHHNNLVNQTELEERLTLTNESKTSCRFECELFHPSSNTEITTPYWILKIIHPAQFGCKPIVLDLFFASIISINLFQCLHIFLAEPVLYRSFMSPSSSMFQISFSYSKLL